jgi:hypothetical protein
MSRTKLRRKFGAIRKRQLHPSCGHASVANDNRKIVKRTIRPENALNQ